ncbi:MAG: DUF2231 domain-containing protein [Brumimicrobium sp.]
MNEIPEFLRTEVWHPLSVHFPVALLLMATLFKLLTLFSKSKTWENAGSFLLYIGTIGAWLAVFTGDQADGIVSRELCDPTILKAHENMSWIVAWLFSVASVLDILRTIKLISLKSRFIKISVVLLLLVGSGYLTYTGHLGAKLVYQQGAGVYHPSEDCGEFSE